jgi:hypothetical protein
MNVIRDTNDGNQYRILENFWGSQINSKVWLLNVISNYLNDNISGTIYVFGGWYGILAQLLSDAYKKSTIISIDIDDRCEHYGNLLKLPNDNIQFITTNMKDWNNYASDTKLVINTSTEHISQDTFDVWASRIPNNVMIALQGNDFYSCNEHIRCSNTLEDFKDMNPLDKYLLQGSLDCQTFTRWITLGYKNEYCYR